MRFRAWKSLSWLSVLGLAWTFPGCAGMEFAPKRQFLYYHKELPAAERAVEAARNAGKEKECPGDFHAAEKMKNEAYEIYWSCRTQEGIARANEAAAKAKGLCPKKVEAPPVPPPAPAPKTASPTVTLSADPFSVDPGKCSTLSWSSKNATDVSIDHGIGAVRPGGSWKVCPGRTAEYTITATGPGGSRTANATVTVNPPTLPPVRKVIDRLTLHVNFDPNKAVIRKADVPELQRAIGFVKTYPEAKIMLEGHTDSQGGDKDNLKLSERRAQAVKKYLEDKGGVKPGRITAVGKGENTPVSGNETEKGRFENRRVEVLIIGD